jgi:hypothetical protein
MLILNLADTLYLLLLFKKKLSFVVHAELLLNLNLLQVEQFLPGAVAADAVPVLPARGLHAGLAQAQLALRPFQPVPQNI